MYGCTYVQHRVPLQKSSIAIIVCVLVNVTSLLFSGGLERRLLSSAAQPPDDGH